MDGTNIRITTKDGWVSIRGKTDQASIPPFLMERLNERFLRMDRASLLDEIFPNGACLYGEGYGARIQKGGGNYRSDVDFVLFDVLVSSEDGRQWWLRRPDIEDVAVKLGLDVVPIIGRGTLADAVAMVKTGFNSTWGAFKAEGLVAKPVVELTSRGGARIITKIKHRDFN